MFRSEVKYQAARYSYKRRDSSGSREWQQRAQRLDEGVVAIILIASRRTMAIRLGCRGRGYGYTPGAWWVRGGCVGGRCGRRDDDRRQARTRKPEEGAGILKYGRSLMRRARQRCSAPASCRPAPDDDANSTDPDRAPGFSRAGWPRPRRDSLVSPRDWLV